MATEISGFSLSFRFGFCLCNRFCGCFCRSSFRRRRGRICIRTAANNASCQNDRTQKCKYFFHCLNLLFPNPLIIKSNFTITYLKQKVKPFLDFQRFLQFSQRRTGKRQHNNNDSFTAYLKCKKTAVYRAKKCCVAVKVSCGASS